MGLDVFTYICDVIKISKLFELNARADVTFIAISLWIWTANETHVIILAASIPTLRPLYLILFNPPASEIYRNKDFGQTSPKYKMKLGRTNAPFGANESTTAVGAVDGDDIRLELGQNQRKADIHETFELEVSSYLKSRNMDEEHTLAQSARYAS